MGKREAGCARKKGAWDPHRREGSKILQSRFGYPEQKAKETIVF